MNKNYLFIAVALIIALAGGYFYGKDVATQNLGATVSYYSSLGNTALRTVLDGLVDDIAIVRAPLSGLLTSAQQYNFMSLASSGNAYAGSLGANATSTPAFTVAGAALGDYCKVSLSADTSTLPHTVDCRVTAASTTVITVVNNSTATIAISTGTAHFWIFPSSSFAAPAATTTGKIATSSSR